MSVEIHDTEPQAWTFGREMVAGAAITLGSVVSAADRRDVLRTLVVAIERELRAYDSPEAIATRELCLLVDVALGLEE